MGVTWSLTRLLPFPMPESIGEPRGSRALPRISLYRHPGSGPKAVPGQADARETCTEVCDGLAPQGPAVQGADGREVQRTRNALPVAALVCGGDAMSLQIRDNYANQ